jgi:hypothetical protein
VLARLKVRSSTKHDDLPRPRAENVRKPGLIDAKPLLSLELPTSLGHLRFGGDAGIKKESDQHGFCPDPDCYHGTTA